MILAAVSPVTRAGELQTAGKIGFKAHHQVRLSPSARGSWMAI
jgi:hypothetical protein